MRALSDLEVGDTGVLIALDLPPGVQNHLMFMGFVPEAHVKVLHRAPAGDPTVYAVDGMEIALRRETAKAIQVRKSVGEIEPVPQPGLSPSLIAADGETRELLEAAR